uniref:porin n=1 Tax=Sphingobium sp. TaxID=1912891 RepID=UPI003B3A2B9B
MTVAKIRSALLAASAIALTPQAAQAQSNEDLQRQIDALKAQVQALTAALAANQATASASGTASASTPVPPSGMASTPAAPPSPPGTPAAPALAAATTPPAPATASAPKSRAWYEKLMLRGYTQLRYNAFLSGDDSAPSGMSRLRSVHDSSISDRGGFSLRRARLVLQGDVSDRVSLYLQSDFATAVNNQAGTERREGFAQLRDAYADVFIDRDKSLRLRFGQSK